MNEVDTLAMADEGMGIFGVIFGILLFLIFILIIAGSWKTFSKAGKPGWGVLIPIYNIILFVQIAGRPLWWIVLLLIPAVGIVVSIVMSIDIAKNFGKGVGFGFGLALLGFIFYPILGFGSAEYEPQE